MSTSQQRFEEDVTTSYRPKTSNKSVIISRSSVGSRPGGRSSMYGMTQSRMSSGLMSNPAVFSKMSATGIAGFRDTREKEKREMQDCNDRLATYIEKVRWLEAQNKKLEAELEALRNRKQEDWKPIRDMFEGELQQARKVISELSTQKGVDESKLAGLQDEIQHLKELISQYEANAKDYNKKIDQLNSQIGEYEGEVTTLRLRCGSLEDELAKVRTLLQKYKDDNARLRADLDAETAAHIEQEVLAQTKTEEAEFYQELLDKLQTMQQEPVTVKGLNMEDFFKGELRKCMSEMQQLYDEQADVLAADYEQKLSAQINQLRSGNVRDSMEGEHMRTEIKRLRDQLGEKSSRLAELETMLATLRAERDNFCAQANELQLELDKERADSLRKLHELQLQIEALMAQLSELIDAKMSLELEIACYKKLLEGEENRTGLRQLVEQNIGSRSSGGQALADIIGQSSLSSSSTARTTVQRSSKGAVGFQGVDPAGANVVIENTSSGARAKNQNLRGWKVRKEVNGKTLCTVDLPQRELRPGQVLTLFAKGAKSEASNDNEIICDQFSWGAGSGQFIITDETGAEKATLKVTQVQ